MCFILCTILTCTEQESLSYGELSAIVKNTYFGGKQHFFVNKHHIWMEMIQYLTCNCYRRICHAILFWFWRTSLVASFNKSILLNKSIKKKINLANSAQNIWTTCVLWFPSNFYFFDMCGWHWLGYFFSTWSG